MSSILKSGVSWFYGSTEKEPRDNSSDKVIWCNFDQIEMNNEIIHCLIICYNNGFQIWQIDEKENFKEILNRRENNNSIIQIFKILSSPNKGKNDLYADKRPIALVYSENEISKPTKLFSCLQNEYFNRSSQQANLCNNKILNISSSSDFVILVCFFLFIFLFYFISFYFIFIFIFIYLFIYLFILF